MCPPPPPGTDRHLHTGQDARINVHFCVLNCGQSQVSVAGSVRNYSDGSLFAFEDRCVFAHASCPENDVFVH